MAKVSVYNTSGKTVGEIELSDKLFALPSNDTLLHQVYVVLSGNLRQVIAHTKDRSERAGSGVKPWKQKGTGRARIGSVRAPHWRKGGVVFGPRNTRNFVRELNRKMRQKAVLIALSEKIRSGKLLVVDTFAFETQKTKQFASFLVSLKIAKRGLLVALDITEKDTERMSRNVEKVINTLAVDVNVKQLLDKEYLLISKQGLETLEKRFVDWNK